MKTRLCEFDPILVESVEKALEPYRETLSPEMLEHFRTEALVLLTTHPYPAALLETLQPDPVLNPVQKESNVELKRGAVPEAARRRLDPKHGQGRRG